ncbi:universal stress protein [uncultured Pontibacter sp.]|uniref:universal stress protein n=1 Tax=uncultured Pontibacter sp. TaxID=453356 RepID=UPI002617050E|nr:universal stress protein [uncultured Pontibacter sp.]
MCKNKNIKRVLVPVQFDKASKKLLRYACQLASTLGAELLLLHNTKTKDLTLTQQSSFIHQLRTFGECIFSEGLKSGAVPVPYECVVKPGCLSNCVAGVVFDYKVDLVLMETCVLHQEEEENDPDNAAAIMEVVSCPVMVMPCTTTFKKIENLVFATDFTDQDDHVLNQIGSFADQAGARLTLVQTYSKSERQQLSNYKAAMRAVEERLTSKNVRLRLLEEEDTLEGISDFAEQSAADMLILATQDNYLLQRLFSSNYIKTAAYHTRYPILTFRQQKKKPCSGLCANCVNKKAVQQQDILNTLAFADTVRR